MKELINQVKKRSAEVTYLKGQKNQIQNMQRSYQGKGPSGYQQDGQNFQRDNQNYQGNNQSFRNNNQVPQKKTWNTGPNNGTMPSPLDSQQAVDNHPVDKVFLAKAALSGWCRLQNTDEHSELQCHDFQVAEDAPMTGYEIVLFSRYDQALVIENVRSPS